MFNTIQPKGIWGDFVQKTAQQNNFSQNTKTYQNQIQPNQIRPQKPVVSSQIQNKEEKQTEKNKFGFFPKLVFLSTAIIAVIWSIPALNKALTKKEKSLPRLERKYNRKIKAFANKEEGLVSNQKKIFEKKLKQVKFQKKIFGKINQTPVLKNAKNRFERAANYIESRIQKPFKTFMQKHVFSFIKK